MTLHWLFWIWRRLQSEELPAPCCAPLPQRSCTQSRYWRTHHAASAQGVTRAMEMWCCSWSSEHHHTAEGCVHMAGYGWPQPCCSLGGDVVMLFTVVWTQSHLWRMCAHGWAPTTMLLTGVKCGDAVHGDCEHCDAAQRWVNTTMLFTDMWTPQHCLWSNVLHTALWIGTTLLTRVNCDSDYRCWYMVMLLTDVGTWAAHRCGNMMLLTDVWTWAAHRCTNTISTLRHSGAMLDPLPYRLKHWLNRSFFTHNTGAPRFVVFILGLLS